MSSACGIRQVESQARAYYVTQFTYKSYKSTDLNFFDKPGLLGLPMNHYTISFFLSS